MNSLIPICPPNPKVLKHLQGRKIGLRIESNEAIGEAVALNRQYGTHMHCLIVVSRFPVADLEFHQEHSSLPIALFAPGLGRFRTLASKLQILRQLNIRIYLPFDCEENFSSLRILSSLGIASVAVFQDVNNDWEKVSDLMTYALMGRVSRAPIDPFNYMAERYSANLRTDFSAVYFNDPTRYIHVDEQGRIALSSRELADRQFISAQIKDLDSLPENDEYRDRLESWRHFFLRTGGCAYCEAWRICLGKFNEHRRENEGCLEFFKELLEAIELYQSLEVRKVDLWQP